MDLSILNKIDTNEKLTDEEYEYLVNSFAVKCNEHYDQRIDIVYYKIVVKIHDRHFLINKKELDYGTKVLSYSGPTEVFSKGNVKTVITTISDDYTNKNGDTVISFRISSEKEVSNV